MSEPDVSPRSDAQYRRGSRELKIIMAVVLLVLVASIVWRAVAHKPATPESAFTPASTTPPPAAAAGAALSPTRVPAPASTAPRVVP